ncbi:GNAT family N-acetyltransferase [Mucilaginibacter psychrotolerans]|uniref:GNAT family N-acetyltransferase n=1 Tax=Mucilaginibacter psychrotolerans TaxID=1524096 RepID=A0A4Y8SFW6_9SPHI|nr:GNAT family N-acetyltransferase [Mucilaginibacter psychrotolerans]TFF37929.1 GNAT family N-acetyltransferase [Mucilaginibacter psychrotolerans]
MNQKYVLEIGNVDDAQVKQLFKEADDYYATLYPDESNHPAFSEDFKIRKSYFIIVRSEDQIVGCGGILVKDNTWGEVKRMYVSKVHRRNKIGTEILLNILNWSTLNNINILKLETGIYQPEAIALYEKFGFKLIEPFEGYEEDPNSVFYEKNLTEL